MGKKPEDIENKCLEFLSNLYCRAGMAVQKSAPSGKQTGDTPEREGLRQTLRGTTPVLEKSKGPN